MKSLVLYPLLVIISTVLCSVVLVGLYLDYNIIDKPDKVYTINETGHVKICCYPCKRLAISGNLTVCRPAIEGFLTIGFFTIKCVNVSYVLTESDPFPLSPVSLNLCLDVIVNEPSTVYEYHADPEKALLIVPASAIFFGLLMLYVGCVEEGLKRKDLGLIKKISYIISLLLLILALYILRQTGLRIFS